MKTELINEFYLMQRSRASVDYNEMLDDSVYTPIRRVNKKMTTWICERGHMLMDLEVRLNSSMKHLRKKYLKF
ncbi:hypothetical protein CPT03_00075 [Pedobacter ginsengisoli]|jgi:hypothetical protein|uniref:Uncharacterized protein n=1 Tax=Pedobacter ginsengisoli TaxID=363852 RepID=A0A2D1U055_9SPHI|nr:hypothetical protein [Pedobacter ginsengisoli]ATP54976.1 hypothetical protein CPT03_00075 [Pedobacter ginsengisoli]